MLGFGRGRESRAEKCYRLLSKDKNRRRERCARANILFDDLLWCDGVQGMALDMLPFIYDSRVGSIKMVPEMICRGELLSNAPGARPPQDREWKAKCKRVLESTVFDYERCVEGEGTLSTNQRDPSSRAYLTLECKDIIKKLKETNQQYIPDFDYPISVSRGIYQILDNERIKLGHRIARQMGVPEQAGEEQTEFEDLFGHWAHTCPILE